MPIQNMSEEIGRSSLFLFVSRAIRRLKIGIYVFNKSLFYLLKEGGQLVNKQVKVQREFAVIFRCWDPAVPESAV